MRWHAVVSGAIVLLSTAGAVALRGAPEAPSPSPRAPALKVAPPIELGDPRAVEPEGFLGVVLARESIDVAARYEGKLRAVHVRIGDRVPEGALIASLDADLSRFDLAEAEASARASDLGREKAEVELADAADKLARKEALGAEALATGEDLAAARFQQKLAKIRLAAAGAQVGEARARARKLRKVLEDAEIRAPFDGVVAERYVDPGANVSPATRIVRLLSARPPFVRFAAPAKAAASLTAGDRVVVRVGDASLGGVIERIAPEVDAASGVVLVEAGLDTSSAPQGLWISGDPARVSILAPDHGGR